VLYLLCIIGKDAYALDANQVAHVLPLVQLSASGEHAPHGLAGFFNYRGTLVPVIDLGDSRSHRRLEPHFSTRVVLVRYPYGGETRLLGLIADAATDVIRRAPSEFAPPATAASSAARGFLLDRRYGIVQWVDVPALLPPALRNSLFTEPVSA
jgi:chemotaxis-related protein WspB